MDKESGGKGWEKDSAALPPSPFHRLRRSLDNANKLKEDILRLRRSLSNTCLSNLHLLATLRKNNSSSLLTCTKVDSSRQSKSPLKLKLQLIETKLKEAKRSMEGEQEHSEVKTTLDTMQSLQEIGTSQTKEFLLESDRFKEKPRLANYAATLPRPQHLHSLSHNPYTVKSKYYLSQLVRAVNNKHSLPMEHLSQSIQMLLQYRLCKLNQESVFQDQPTICLPSQPLGNKKTLLLDLDETLIHCFEKSSATSDLQLTIQIDGCPIEVGINIRPYAITFLKRMRKRWEIVIFTASHQSYADAILNEIDPDGELFDHRLYRQHCRQLATDFFIKDLSRINREPARMVLVDNSAYSYAMQLDNAIPILPYYEGKDYQLSALEHYLNRLSDCQDVRLVNREHFQLHRYTSFDNAASLVQQLYCPLLPH